MATVTQAISVYAPGTVNGQEQRYKQAAAGALGSSSLWTFWDDFQSLANWTPANVGTGTVSGGITGEPSGSQVQLSTGATAASQGAQSNTNGNVGVHIPQSFPWYCATRFRLSTAMDAQAIACTAINGAGTTRTIAAGFCGPLNATNFTIQHSGALGAGSVLDLAVAIDTNYHVIEWWGAGGSSLNARIDGGSIKTATMSLLDNAYSIISQIVKNGTTATNRAMIVDWFLAAGVR